MTYQKTRRYLTIDTVKCIYNYLFVSFLQYGILFGDQLTSCTRKQYLSCKKAIRIISNQTSCSNSLRLFKDLHLLRLSDIFKFKLLAFIYELTKLLTPSCFYDCFSFKSAIHSYATRQSRRGDLYLLTKIRFDTDWGAKLWNELPRKIRNSFFKFIFRKNFKSTFIPQHQFLAF